jgi:hypothetical protein
LRHGAARPTITGNPATGTRGESGSPRSTRPSTRQARDHNNMITAKVAAAVMFEMIALIALIAEQR